MYGVFRAVKLANVPSENGRDTTATSKCSSTANGQLNMQIFINSLAPSHDKFLYYTNGNVLETFDIFFIFLLFVS